MENKFEQMASTSQSEHQVKKFKSKKKLNNYQKKEMVEAINMLHELLN